MELRNLLDKAVKSSKISPETAKFSAKLFITALYPYAPHFAAYLWRKMPQSEGEVWETEWAQWDEELKTWRGGS